MSGRLETRLAKLEQRRREQSEADDPNRPPDFAEVFGYPRGTPFAKILQDDADRIAREVADGTSKGLPMTLKNRIDKLEHRADDQGSFGNVYVEWLRAERIRLLNDPEALGRIRLEALREDDPEGYARCMAQRAKTGVDSLPPRETP